MKTTFSSSFTNPAFSLSFIGVDRFCLLLKGWSLKVLSLLLVVMAGGLSWGQVNITPIRTDVAGFSSWTDANLAGTNYLQLLTSTSQTISPAMNFDNYSSESLSFTARTFGGTTASEIILTVWISVNNGTNWTNLGTRTPGSATLTSQTPFDISSYNGTQVKLKFTVGGTSATVGVGIDDISITGSLIASSPPSLTAALSPTVDGAFNVTFTDDASWRAAITSITFEGTTITAGYSVTAGQITFTPSASIPTTLLQSSGSKTIVVNATGYANASVSQTIGFGAANKLGITTQPTAPASNGAVLAVQPVVVIQDQYGNTTTSTANVTAAVGSGSWTLGGTNTISATAGSATFSGLTAASSTAVTGATITFTCGSLTGITSSSFNISAPPLGIPTAGAASNVSCSNFTANWTTVTGATSGYLLDVSTKVNFCNNATDLFISEYVEGSSNNKYIEIFNGTGSDVNLTNYQLQMFANGASTATTSVTLSGTLANGNTIVYKNTSATAYSNTATTNTAVNFNGNDAVALYKISTASYVDIFGVIGIDPNTAWTSGSYSTLDKTLVRKSTVYSGVTTNPTSFSTLSSEWDLYNIDDVSHLGSHTFYAPSFVSGYEAKIISGQATTNDVVNGLNSGTTYYYRVRANSGSSISGNSSTITVTTATPPSIPTGTGASRCDDGTVTISAIPSSGATIDWYSASTGGTLLASGSTSYVTPIISSTTVYYAEARNTSGGCTSVSRQAVTATVNTTPSAPTANASQTFCTGATISNLSATGSSIQWYAAATSGSPLAVGGTLVDNTHYYVSRTINGCESSRTDVTATVNAIPSVPTSNSASRCGTGTVSISATPSTNETIDWYASATGGAALASGASSTTLTFTTPSISSTTIYYAEARNLTTSCTSATRTAVTATVNPDNTASVASPTPTLCINTSLTAITHNTTGATGIGSPTGLPIGVSASWASNTITISGTPTQSGTFNYSIPLTGGCGSVNATGTIIVNANYTVGTASSTQTVLANTTLTNITHTTTGATGISGAGQSGANTLPAGVSAAWASNTITISGTPTSVGTFTYSIPLTGGCGSAYATGTITVVDAYTWTGAVSSAWSESNNWSPIGVPTSADNVNITSVSSPYYPLEDLSSLTINSSVTFTVKSNAKLTMNGNIINNGTFIIENGGTLLQGLNSQISGNGTFRVLQNVTGTSTGNFRSYYLGSPLNSTSSSVFSPTTSNNLLYNWNANTTNPNWYQITSNSASIDLGVGYLARFANPTTLTFEGTGLNNVFFNNAPTGFNIQVPCYRQASSSYQGFNLVSNPFPSYLDWNDVYTANSTNFLSTIWYRIANGSNAMVFDTYNATGGACTNISGYNASRYIAPMQAFWVRIPSGGPSTANLNFSNSMREHYVSGVAGLRSSSQEFPAFLRLNLVQGNTLDQIILYMKPDASSAFDSYDSEKMFLSGTPQLYSKVLGKSLVINGMRNNKKKTSVPLSLDLPTTGLYFFQAEEYNIEDGLIILEDKQENVFQDLTLNNAYSFYHSSGTVNDRFVIHFHLPDASITAQGPSNIELVDNDIHVEEAPIEIASNGNGKVIVSLGNQEKPEGRVQVLDASGRIIFESMLSDAETMFDLQTSAGIYYVKVSTVTSEELKKIVVQP